MDSSRRTSSRRDTTAGASRDSSNRSRPLDLSRPPNPVYDRAYSTHDTTGQEGSPSGYNRAYSTHDAAQRYSIHLGFPTVQLQETSHQGESSGLLWDVVSDDRILGQTSEQRTLTFGQWHESQDKSGLSEETGKKNLRDFNPPISTKSSANKHWEDVWELESDSHDLHKRFSYSDLTTAINKGRQLLDKANQLAYRNPNPDSSYAFGSRYTSKIKKEYRSSYIVTTKVKNVPDDVEPHYKNRINIETGEITAIRNYKDIDTSYGGEEVLYNSEIIYNQLLLALKEHGINISNFNLRAVKSEYITNEESRETLKAITPWPDIYQFEQGSDQYYAAVRTPTATRALYLAKQYPHTIGNKKIKTVEVHSSDNGRFDMTIYMS